VAVLEKNIMISLAENAIKAALNKGAQDAEAYVYEGQASNIGIELGQISKINRIIDRGLGIRVATNKAIGFAYTNIIEDPKALERVVVSALSSARAGKPDQDWNGLPGKKPYAATEKTFDQKIVNLSSEDLVQLAVTMLDAAGQVDKRVFPIEGAVGGATPQARPVIDFHRDDATTLTQGECGQESVHVVEIGQLEKKLAPKDLQATAGIRGVVPKQAPAHAIGDT